MLCEMMWTVKMLINIKLGNAQKTSIFATFMVSFFDVGYTTLK